MALDASSLTAAIKAGLLALPAGTGSLTYDDVMTDDQKDVMEANISVQASKVVDHIVDNAVATVAMVSHTHTGVMTGGGISGPPVPGVAEVGSATTTPTGGVT